MGAREIIDSCPLWGTGGIQKFDKKILDYILVFYYILYYSKPSTWSPYMNVNSKRCPQNHKCPAVRYCPEGAIEQAGNGLPKVNESKCKHCNVCVTFCPMGAIEG